MDSRALQRLIALLVGSQDEDTVAAAPQGDSGRIDEQRNIAALSVGLDTQHVGPGLLQGSARDVGDEVTLPRAGLATAGFVPLIQPHSEAPSGILEIVAILARA